MCKLSQLFKHKPKKYLIVIHLYQLCKAEVLEETQLTYLIRYTYEYGTRWVRTERLRKSHPSILEVC